MKISPLALSFCFLLSLTISCDAHITVVKAPAAAPMLNSERIQQKFGSYGVQVLDSKVPNLRISNLHSLENGTKICRTFAVTRFEANLHPALAEAHRGIVTQGQSIGSTFKDLGFAVSKTNLFIGDFEPKTPCIFKLMGDTKPQSLAVYIYRLSLSKGDLKDIPYATIAELQHPDYLKVDDLKTIYSSSVSQSDLSETWAFIYAALGNLSCDGNNQ